MNILKSHQEIALASIRCFTDDGELDLGELNFLLGIALRDDKIDDDEKRVLQDIFRKVSKHEVKPVVWQRIKDVRKKYNI